MDAEKLYKRLEIAAREIFGDFNINLAEMEPDEYGRGGSPDDIVYKISTMNREYDDGEWSAMKLQFVIRAVKLYTEMYCEDKGIEIPKMHMRFDNEELHIIKINEIDNPDDIIHIEDTHLIHYLFGKAAYSTKENILESIEYLVPRFITQPLVAEGGDMKIESIEYCDSREVKITYRY